MDDSWVIILIQALVNAKTANKWFINTHSYSDVVHNIQYSCTPFNHISVVSCTTILMTYNKWWSGKLYATMIWKQSETSSHKGWRNDESMKVQEIEVRRRMYRYAWIQWLGIATQTVICTRWGCLFLPGAFKIPALRTSLLMNMCSHNLFSDMSFAGLNIHLVTIQLCLHSNRWELKPLWVSEVHGWVGVGGHLAESLTRICFLG